jgi:phosphate:Na+ symporter
VQSSSAVTIAVIGFVNAGLLNLYQAIGVIYGTNIGTTMTGWLVSLVGFNIKIEIFALPLIGIGMAMGLMKNDSRSGHIGKAIVGFGLFFIGIDVLKQAFDGLATSIDLQHWQIEGIPGIAIYVAIGFMITVLTQSSSASIAITLTAASGGILNLYAAAAMVIGANVGTTSTAGFAAIGATPNAKRIATAHIIFNLLTGIVALLLLPLMLWSVKTTQEFIGLADIHAVSLALFHTIFNIMGVLLMLPLSTKMVSLLQNRFKSTEEIEGTPKYLDKTIAVTPELALNAIVLEMGRLAELSRVMAMGALSTERKLSRLIESNHNAVKSLETSIGEFIMRLEKGTLSENVAGLLPKILHTLQYYVRLSEAAWHFSNIQIKLDIPHDDEIRNLVNSYKASVAAFLETNVPDYPEYSEENEESKRKQLHEDYSTLRDTILNAASTRRIAINHMDELLDQLNRVDRIVRQASKAASGLHSLLVKLNLTNSEANL